MDVLEQEVAKLKAENDQLKNRVDRLSSENAMLKDRLKRAGEEIPSSSPSLGERVRKLTKINSAPFSAKSTAATAGACLAVCFSKPFYFYTPYLYFCFYFFRLSCSVLACYSTPLFEPIL